MLRGTLRGVTNRVENGEGAHEERARGDWMKRGAAGRGKLP